MTAPTAERNHVLVATRLALVGNRTRLLTVIGVIAAVMLFTAAVTVLADTDTGNDGNSNVGLLVVVYVTALTAYLQTMTQTFSFALSLGITRRHFATAVGLLVLAEAALTALVLTVLLEIERATGGWGLGMRFFALGDLVRPDPVTQLLVFAAPFAALAGIGVLMGAVFKCWGAFGVWSVVIGTGAVVALAALLATWLRAWPAIGATLAATPSFALVAGLPALVAVVVGAAAFLVVRRATP